MAVTGAFPVAVTLYFAAAAEAAHCGQPCHSDRRLKKNIRPI
jgi:hypothetical protein